jgi:hypothetical protein
MLESRVVSSGFLREAFLLSAKIHEMNKRSIKPPEGELGFPLAPIGGDL